MTLPSVTITSSVLSPSTKTIRCQSVKIGHKRQVTTEPNANSTGVVEAQTQSYENPKYSVQGVFFTGESNTLTYDDCVLLTKLDFDGSNAPVLTVSYNLADSNGNFTNSLQVLSDSAGGTSGVSVVVESFDATVDASDSRGAYRPTASIDFRETATD